jgi:hypothetical protein
VSDPGSGPPAGTPVLDQPPAAAVSAAELDRALGDPDDETRVLSYANVLRADREERFPAEMCAELDRLGCARHYVPVELGGLLDDFAVAAGRLRTIARRDLTVAVAHAQT